MKPARTLALLLLPLLLTGCVKVFIVGHTDDWADYFTGEGDADPMAGEGASAIEFQKSKLKCAGTFKDYYRTAFGPGTRTRGQFKCSDGRTIETDSVVLSLSHGSGTGRDSFGIGGRYLFTTETGMYEAELGKVREEVTRRNLGVEHIVNPAARTAAQPPAAPPPTAPPADEPRAAGAAPAAVSPPLTAAAKPAAAPGDGRKLALLIGNGAYREAPLKNPVNDVRALAAKLKALGFETMVGENLGQREMTRLLTRFGERLAGGSVGLFYYAGHGMQVKGRNYLIPVDAQISSEASARSESIDVEQALEQMAGAGNAFNLVILDACRNNPFERRFRSLSGGLAQIDAPKGTLIAFATAPGKVALDGEGANSLYAAALLRTLGEPGLAVESVFKRVRAEVARGTGDQQVPWESSSLTGDFYFVPAPAAQEKVGDAELLFWQSVKDSVDAADFEAYLKKYPAGQFADIARNRLRKLAK